MRIERGLALAAVAAIAVAIAGCAPDDPSTPANDAPAVDESKATPSPTVPPAPTIAPSPTATSPNGRVSRYTSLRDCRVTEAKPEEAGYSRAECPAIGGYAVQLVEADGRQNLMIRGPHGGEARSLRLAELSGGAFNALGERLEWRGSEKGGGFVPDALVVRNGVQEDPGNPKRETAYLIVAKLTGKGPCPAGRIAPQPGQNERAQALADSAPACLKQ